MTPKHACTTSEADAGLAMHELMGELLPICRSITGDGVRETLRRLQAHARVELVETPSGMPVFDWTVPKEWNIRGAQLRGPNGDIVADLRDSSLHVVSYSIPVRQRMSLDELRPHLHSDSRHPDWIPYRTSYYKPGWGFCLTDRQLRSLEEGEYDVWIDSSLEDGHLTYGECYLPGESSDEIFLSTHVCHPAMCNDNLSGVVIAAFAAKLLAARRMRHSVRIVFVPGCIGAIAWLANNPDAAARIRHGLVITCAGDPGRFTYKRSRRGDAAIDRAAAHFLKHSGHDYAIAEFTPYGYDERQYCSPGFDLPVGCFMRTPHGEFAEYHTSADDLSLVRPENLAVSLEALMGILDIVDSDSRWLNLNPKCEPQLGRRGLYRSAGGGSAPDASDLARLWTLNFSDGNNTLLDIAERSGQPFSAIATAARELSNVNLLTNQI